MILSEDLLNDKHFKRKMTAAKAGVHLPSEDELLRGMLFFKDHLVEDIREYAGRMARVLKRRKQAGSVAMLACLEELVVDPGFEAVLALEAVLDEAKAWKRFPVVACRLRCRIYRAWMGDSEAMALIAAEAADRACDDARRDGVTHLMWRSLSWGSLAARTGKVEDIDFTFAGSLFHTGQELNRTQQLFRRAFYRAVELEVEERLPKEAAKPKQDDAKVRLPVDDLDDDDDVASPGTPPDGVVVVTEIGNDTTQEGKRVAKEYSALVGKHIPLCATPDLAVVRKELVEEFPYAENVIDTLLAGMTGRDHVWMRPTILLGSPGCGKTRFARRFSEVTAIPYELVPCGGMSDSGIGGTPRRWSTGEPSVPVGAIRRHKCANPCIILDEIEKVGTGRNNGNPHDVLLGLFEDETAQRWHDPYIEAHCNMSFVIWLMTANAVESVPGVLRDRCRILRFPEPGPQYLDVLAHRILRRLYAETGHDPRWATPLAGYERNALQQAWPGGSIRRLERLVEGLIEARGQAQVTQ